MITEDALMAYLDGEAGPEQERAVEAALAASPQLRARLAELEARDRTVRTAFDSLLERPVPDHLVSAARGGDAPKILPFQPRRPLQGGGYAGVVAAVRRRPVLVGWLAVGQAAVIAVAVMATLSTQNAQPTSSRYLALAAAQRPATANAMVIFDPSTPERQLREALKTADARVVGGPTDAGVYLLETPAASRDSAVRTLKARKDVVLAEPLDSGHP